MTPFAARAIDRGLAALLVSLARHGDQRLNPNDAARSVRNVQGFADEAIEVIRRRVELLLGSNEAAEVEARLRSLVDEWASRASKIPTLAYKRAWDGTTVGLLRRPEEGDWEDYTCLNSLREVEPTSKLVLLGDPTRPFSGSET